MHMQLVVVAKLDAELSEDSVHFACACSSPWHAHLLILKEEVHKDSTLCDALASSPLSSCDVPGVGIMAAAACACDGSGRYSRLEPC